MIRSSTVRGEISIDNVLVMEKLEGLRVDMKTVNAYYRDYRTLEGCSGLTFEVHWKATSVHVSCDWKKPLSIAILLSTIAPENSKSSSAQPLPCGGSLTRCGWSMNCP